MVKYEAIICKDEDCANMRIVRSDAYIIPRSVIATERATVVFDCKAIVEEWLCVNNISWEDKDGDLFGALEALKEKI